MEARKTYFMVRAEVPNASDRAKFDQWYGTHHLPLAMDKFHCEKGWRFWSLERTGDEGRAIREANAVFARQAGTSK